MRTQTETKSPTQVAVGELIRKAREAQGLTQLDVSERLGELGMPTARATVNRTEQGLRDIGVGEMDAYAKVLDIPVERLWPPMSREASLLGLRDHRLTISALDMALDDALARIVELRQFIVVQSRRLDAAEAQI